MKNFRFFSLFFLLGITLLVAAGEDQNVTPEKQLENAVRRECANSKTLKECHNHMKLLLSKLNTYPDTLDKFFSDEPYKPCKRAQKALAEFRYEEKGQACRQAMINNMRITPDEAASLDRCIKDRTVTSFVENWWECGSKRRARMWVRLHDIPEDETVRGNGFSTCENILKKLYGEKYRKQECSCCES